MEYFLPEAVIDAIQQNYRKGVKQAEKGYRYAQEEEDTVTGALGQALIADDQAVITDGAVYVWRTTYQKFRGRGPNATEKVLGADGIFQIEVNGGKGEMIFRKGLLFQAKNKWLSKDAKLKSQAGLMEGPFHNPIGVVLNYLPNGFFAVPADPVYRADGDWRDLPPDSIKPLETVLAEEFLFCRLGVRDVFYDPDVKLLYFPPGIYPKGSMSYRHVITTKVIEVKLP